MRTTICLLIIASLGLLQVGCGSFEDIGSVDGPKIMGGIRHDWNKLGDGTESTPKKILWGADLPFSLVLDIILLPVTGIRAAIGDDDEPKS